MKIGKFSITIDNSHYILANELNSMPDKLSNTLYNKTHGSLYGKLWLDIQVQIHDNMRNAIKNENR